MNPRPHDVEGELERLHEESFGWALGCCGYDHAEAEDVLQMTYMRVISGKARYGGKSLFRTWLFGVIRLVAMENRRRDQRRDKLNVTAASQLTLVTSDSADADIERSESSRALLEAMEQLPERQRQVLHLVFYEGLTVQEAGDVMGVSVGSARTHYARAKDAMRAQLGGLLG
ncbi:MAG: RNA polymerase sigma factor [Longimicrobiales bacterium]